MGFVVKLVSRASGLDKKGAVVVFVCIVPVKLLKSIPNGASDTGAAIAGAGAGIDMACDVCSGAVVVFTAGLKFRLYVSNTAAISKPGVRWVWLIRRCSRPPGC